MSNLHELTSHFKAIASEDKLSHAYIFFGEDKELLLSFAKNLVNFLESGNFEESEKPFSDALIIVPDQGGSIGIDAARALKGFLASRPAVSRRRVAIIHRGETLTPEAQNALLKIAEEPPEMGLLIITARNAGSLLGTVSSRFQKIHVNGGDTAKSQKRGGYSPGKFLNSSSAARSAMIKEMLEDEEKRAENAEHFLNELILELRKDLLSMPQRAREIAFVLRRKQLMDEYNTNIRLQLEAIAKVL